jgi:crotonobetainyl-CoA:carnitine CoA-transferase CaiB-like acyl-CoA transferase
MQQALSGVTVLDLTHYVAGPYCTKLLADYGAEVLKIERPGIGDGARRLGIPPEAPDSVLSPLFLNLNTNKKSITLDLKTDAGKAVLSRLIRESDILVESFSPGVMARVGFDYAAVAKINPAIVMTSVSNFGQTGPYRDYRATELVSFGLGVHMFQEGEPDREPLKFPGYKPFYLAGTYAAAVTLGTFLGSSVTGEGEYIDVSIMECQLSPPEGACFLMNYAFSGVAAGRQGHRREWAYPFGVYACKDGHVFIYGIVAFFWPRFVEWLGMPELLTDPRFSTPLARREHHADFDAVFLPWLMEKTVAEAFHSAQAHRIPCTPVNAIADMLADPQLAARSYFTQVNHPDGSLHNYPGLPFRLPETPTALQQAAPALGQHNDEVCGRLGFSPEEILRMRREGAI